MFLVMGVAAALGFHVLVNVAMVIGAMPVTGNPFAADVLRRFRHVVCIPGDWPGNECPATPIR